MKLHRLFVISWLMAFLGSGTESHMEKRRRESGYLEGYPGRGSLGWAARRRPQRELKILPEFSRYSV